MSGQFSWPLLCVLFTGLVLGWKNIGVKIPFLPETPVITSALPLIHVHLGWREGGGSGGLNARQLVLCIGKMLAEGSYK